MTRVLVIDDNQDFRELIQVMLDDAGYETEGVADGKAGLEAQHRLPAALVITDIFMPNQDGFETIALLRAKFPAVKIIAVSGGGRASDPQSYLRMVLRLGADASLSKPFEEEQLLAAVRRVLAVPESGP